jgi:hypothetical protein
VALIRVPTPNAVAVFARLVLKLLDPVAIATLEVEVNPL